jgi:hypothetical protein
VRPEPPLSSDCMYGFRPLGTLSLIGGTVYRARALLGLLMHAMNPPVLNDEFDDFVWRVRLLLSLSLSLSLSVLFMYTEVHLQHKKMYMTTEERAMRRSQFYYHKRLIEEHNRRTDVTFKSAPSAFRLLLLLPIFFFFSASCTEYEILRCIQSKVADISSRSGNEPIRRHDSVRSLSVCVCVCSISVLFSLFLSAVCDADAGRRLRP